MNEKIAPRLISLDAFRGATIALMVLVNNAGSGRDSYPQLEHAEWHGWTITDTVFPSFVWIVGVAITLSLGKRLAAGVPKSLLIAQIARRAKIKRRFSRIRSETKHKLARLSVRSIHAKGGSWSIVAFELPGRLNGRPGWATEWRAKYGFDLFARNGSGSKQGRLADNAYNRRFKASFRRPRIQYHVNAAA